MKLENENISLTFDDRNGSLTAVLDKQTGLVHSNLRGNDKNEVLVWMS